MLLLVLAFAILSGRGASAATSAKAQHHCISGGLDLNVFYGVSEPIVARHCPAVGSGNFFRVSASWLMNTSFEAVPPGFEPAGGTPLEDLLAKLVEVEVVLDAGTAQERTYVFPNDGTLGTGSSNGFVLANSLTLGTLRPARVGEHTIDVYWVLSAMHCDGLTDNIPFSCLPAGENRFRTFQPTFEVTPGHN
jgi:hypothetical protein